MCKLAKMASKNSEDAEIRFGQKEWFSFEEERDAIQIFIQEVKDFRRSRASGSSQPTQPTDGTSPQ